MEFNGITASQFNGMDDADYEAYRQAQQDRCEGCPKHGTPHNHSLCYAAPKQESYRLSNRGKPLKRGVKYQTPTDIHICPLGHKLTDPRDRRETR